MDLTEMLYGAVRSHEWSVVAAICVIGIVWLIRNNRFTKYVPWLSKDRGGVALAVVTSVALTLATAWLADKSLSLSDVYAALLVAAEAMGVYVGVKKAQTEEPVVEE